MTVPSALMERQNLESSAPNLDAARDTASELVTRLRQLAATSREKPGGMEPIDELIQLAESLQRDLFESAPINGHRRGDDGDKRSESRHAGMNTFPPNIVATINMPIG